MTTLAPPELTRPDAPDFTVWDVIAAHIHLSGMTRPEPRPCEPLPYCAGYGEVAVDVWQTITAAHVSRVAVAATYPEWRVVERDGGVSFPGIPGFEIGGGISQNPPSFGDTGALIPDPKPAPDIAPIPLPAALPLLVAALFLLWRMTR